MPGRFADMADGLPTTVKAAEERDEIGEALLKKMLLNLQTLSRPSVRPIEFRTSGLPFCPIKSFLLSDRKESYSMDHYTSTGTAIHETLQKWLALGDYKQHMYGDWQCSSCGKKKKMQLMPEVCTCRSNSAQWIYKEISISYKKLTGHIDLILQLNFTGKIRYVVIDFKSTDMERKRSKVNWDPLQPSSRNYVVQVRTYCTVLTLEYGLNIVGWILPSINRASPITDEQGFHPLAGEWSKKLSDRWVKYLDAANYDFIVLKRLMRHLKERNVEEANDWLIEMVKTRPCHDEEQYKKWMHYAFYGKDVCPMKNTCCKGKNKPVLAEIRQRLREKE